ncbi:MAG TPA: DNA replication and repair protein RecF [Acidimicrobiales bacterium]|nr:DNA replication and repair protein RecF [Acidimicrobiales bacterium]
MYFNQLWLKDFRNYRGAELMIPAEGVILFEGENGSGKSNLLEAFAYVATLRSFRGAPVGALIRTGASEAVLRGVAQSGQREVLVEVQLIASGRGVVRINRQPLRRSQELSSVVPVIVFSPDDLELVKGVPEARRDYLDELLVNLHGRDATLRADFGRVLHQRNALLRSMGGIVRSVVGRTLDVWDDKLAELGESLARERESVVDSLRPYVRDATRRLGAEPTSGLSVGLAYERSWRGTLAEAVGAARHEDVRRGVTTVGPQRDDLIVSLGGLPARVQASQAEQRCLALGLRLGAHSLVAAARGVNPVLVLDDVFSELDARRSTALAASLPVGQTLLASAVSPPPGLPVAARARIVQGTVASIDLA